MIDLNFVQLLRDDGGSALMVLGGVPVTLRADSCRFDIAALAERLIEVMNAADPKWVCPKVNLSKEAGDASMEAGGAAGRGAGGGV